MQHFKRSARQSTKQFQSCITEKTFNMQCRCFTDYLNFFELKKWEVEEFRCKCKCVPTLTDCTVGQKQTCPWARHQNQSLLCGSCSFLPAAALSLGERSEWNIVLGGEWWMCCFFHTHTCLKITKFLSNNPTCSIIAVRLHAAVYQDNNKHFQAHSFNRSVSPTLSSYHEKQQKERQYLKMVGYNSAV